MSDDNTPARTPSAMHRLGLVPCPACRKADGEVDCKLCENARVVPVDKAIEWEQAQSK